LQRGVVRNRRGPKGYRRVKDFSEQKGVDLNFGGGGKKKRDRPILGYQGVNVAGVTQSKKGDQELKQRNAMPKSVQNSWPNHGGGDSKV